MPTYLTAEQEIRLQAIVRTGLYPSAEEALDAALMIVEKTASHECEGSPDELDGLLLEGLNSGASSDAHDAWQRITAQTDQMIAEHLAQRRRS